MEFREKLQELRKRNKLTQEQLSEMLHISRTAVSKWESGRGFPNIEALKNISRVFDTPIDELLSGEELLDAAEKDGKTARRRNIGLIFGVFDLLFLTVMFLPFFGDRDGDGYIRSVSLFRYDDGGWTKLAYFIALAAVGAYGAVEAIIAFRAGPRASRALRLASIAAHSLAILLFVMTREPYVNGYLFAFLLAKILFLLKKT